MLSYCLKCGKKKQKKKSKSCKDKKWKNDDVFKTSLRRLGQDQNIRLGHTSLRRLQDVFKTSSRHLQDVLPRRLQDVLQKRLQDIFKTSSRCLQDVLKTSSSLFKTYHQVKLFLLTRL